jgi:F420-dependent oxidoreductase-like protein
VRLCLMIEGQEGVTWDGWVELARSCEEGGLEGLFRSDHYLSVQGRTEGGSLDAWSTLAGLASLTDRIKLGTLVSPATFRHPSVLAKSVVTVDHISGGRVELGIGAGWLSAEHESYGFDFPDSAMRVELLEEQIEIICRQWTEGSFNFDGRNYRIKNLDALPKPVQRPRPNLIVGGSGGRRSAAIAARWADEYNTVFATPEECARIRDRVEKTWAAANRNPADLVFSLMTGCVVGSDTAELQSRARAVMDRSGESGSAGDWLDSLPDEWIVGTVEEVVDKLGELAEAGVQRVMLQHQNHTDTDMVRLLGEEIGPRVA